MYTSTRSGASEFSLVGTTAYGFDSDLTLGGVHEAGAFLIAFTPDSTETTEEGFVPWSCGISGSLFSCTVTGYNAADIWYDYPEPAGPIVIAPPGYPVYGSVITLKVLAP